jgi:hypothetical protein
MGPPVPTRPVTHGIGCRRRRRRRRCSLLPQQPPQLIMLLLLLLKRLGRMQRQRRGEGRVTHACIKNVDLTRNSVCCGRGWKLRLGPRKAERGIEEWTRVGREEVAGAQPEGELE